MTSPGVFDADPLRLLRAARIAAEIEFELEPETEGAVRSLASRVLESSPERIRDELARIFALERAHDGVRLLDRLALLDVLMPELAGGRGVAQPENHHRFDVFEHNLLTVRALDAMLGENEPHGDDAWLWRVTWSTFAWHAGSMRDYLREGMSEGRSRAAIVKLAGLLHDVAKPRTKSVDPDGRIRFFNHGDIGAEMASAIMRRYRFSSREAHFVATLVAEHLRPVLLAAVGEVPTDRAVYRFHRDLGDATPAVLLLALADAWAAHGAGTEPERWARQAAYMNSLLMRSHEQAVIVDAPRLVTGHDIMAEFGLPPGPQIGRLLEAVREAQATGQVQHREGALAFLRTRVQAGEREDGGR